MEYLDYYDEEGNYLGYETRAVVHRDGLWHKTVQCWLYTKEGGVFFQIRKDKKTFYTTASGHVDKGESVEDAYKREIKEEIGLNVSEEDATYEFPVTWIKDEVKKDGSLVKDRAKSSFYSILFKGSYDDFHFDPEEVLGVVLVDAKEALDLFERGSGQIEATLIVDEDGKNVVAKRMVDIEEFLVTDNETRYEKYGKILQRIIEKTKNGK